MSKVRILVVDGSVVVRRLLTNVLSSDPSLEVVGSAPNGRIAMAKVPQVNPDVITLNTEMPDGDGPQTLDALRKAYPQVRVIVFVSRIDEDRIRDELIPSIKTCHAASTRNARAGEPERAGRKGTGQEPAARALERRIDVVVIAVSTGGPNALTELLPEFPSDLPVPVLIVQHMPPTFTDLLAARLDTICDLRVSEGVVNEVVGPGHAWMAPGDFHMVVRKEGALVRIQTHQGPPENSCRPSADVLFRSVAEAYGAHVLAVVLTGMGQDGLRGCERVHELGGRVFVQDEASSVIWGMPRFVVNAGLADKILPLRQLGTEIMRSVGVHRPSWPGRSSAITGPRHD
jgi:two-component system, chemotaxis family, protein-glutamate methylesterase/glutaminase